MVSEGLFFYVFYVVVLVIPLGFYARWYVRREERARQAAVQGELFSEGPRGQHPSIDVTYCIGCQACTSVCPEGQVLGMVGGKAALLRPDKCIGHGLCAAACPVGAIKILTAGPALRADLPFLTSELETSIDNLYIAGELGGLALIRNAVAQGSDIIDTIARRLAAAGRPSYAPDVYDVLIVGAGPAGISASLRAIERKLNYLTIERDTIGGAVAKYPRQKLVMTGRIEFPLSAALKKMELSKENLLSFWKTICDRPEFHVKLNEPVENIRKADGLFTVVTTTGEYRAAAVVLALGRSGTPRKLNIKGEDLPKVMYRLLEADHYTNSEILVVGGGDSAVEAAIGLAMQKGNRVTLSYRKAAFSRIKERNAHRLQEAERSGRLRVIFNSNPVEITGLSVYLDVAGKVVELPNDHVWIFAGGVAPNDFLQKISVAFGSKDLTAEGVQEAANVLASTQALREMGKC